METFTFQPKNIFYRNLHYPRLDRLIFFNFKKGLKKIFQNQCFSGYTDVVMMYINLTVDRHTQGFTKETGFCNCYWFCTDATMVGKKNQRISN